MSFIFYSKNHEHFNKSASFEILVPLLPISYLPCDARQKFDMELTTNTIVIKKSNFDGHMLQISYSTIIQTLSHCI